MKPSLFQTLGIIDCVILKHCGGDTFSVVHGNQPWLFQLVPAASLDSTFAVLQDSPFLADFLIDADAFWQQGNTGQIHSGIWSEQVEGDILRLDAIAANHEGEHFLVLSNVQHEFDRQQKTLQSARELLLANDKIVAQHEYVHERLDALLRENQQLEIQNKPIQQAIDNTDCAVMILDNSLQLERYNAITLDLFEITEDTRINPPSELILRLVENQYPEYQRVISNANRWQGEVFWHKPPFTNKWLQVAMIPVRNALQAVTHWVITASDITRLKYLLQTNEKLTLQDTITRLPNRQAFWRALEQKFEQGAPFYLLCIDIKRFKSINELHGHAIGDEVLILVADRIKRLINKQDLVARAGGDEFAVILSEAQVQSQSGSFVSRLFEAFRSPVEIPGHPEIEVEFSVGAASYPADASSAEDLMRFADLALHSAKQQTKNSLKFYSEKLKNASRERLLLEQALRKAIEQRQFELFLQPMLDLQSGKVIRAEALLRWRGDNGQLIEPAKFIPVAEQTGLIVPIGKWVITRACEILQTLQMNNSDIVLSINLSPRQIADRRLFDYINGCIKASGIDPEKLELELTEGVLIHDFEQVQRLLESVRKLGIGVAIDDFGTGYCSLAYLQRLPIDHVKIDRSFVRDLDTNENDQAIVLAVIAMAHSLKLGVVAEGVETEQQRQFLAKHHCDSAQGFLFGKPMSLTQFTEAFLTR